MLTPAQHDAFTELINIGYGRAAAALSAMTGQRIELEVPRLSVTKLECVAPELSKELHGVVVCVNEFFSGPFAGNAMLLFDSAAATALSELLAAEAGPRDYAPDVRETITEAGQIFLNACLGAFGNLLAVQVAFTVPEFRMANLQPMLASVRTANESLDHALIVQTRFRLKSSGVSGCLVLIFGVTSLQNVLKALEAWAGD